MSVAIAGAVCVAVRTLSWVDHARRFWEGARPRALSRNWQSLGLG